MGPARVPLAQFISMRPPLASAVKIICSWPGALAQVPCTERTGELGGAAELWFTLTPKTAADKMSLVLFMARVPVRFWLAA
jgi:hypothetical protein